MLPFTRMMQETYDYRELLLALTSRDIKVRYKQAVFGVLWAFLIPCLAVCSGVVIRLAMVYFNKGDFSALRATDVVGVMVKSVPWILFASVVGSVSSSLLGSTSLITKIYFPRQIVPLASALAALFDWVISLLGLVVVLTVLALLTPNGFGVVVSPSLWLLPVLLVLLLVMALGLGLGLAALNLFLRDVKYLVNVALQFGVFFSLVYWRHDELGSKGWLLLLNPVAPVLEAIGAIVTTGSLDVVVKAGHVVCPLWVFLAYSAAVAGILLLVGCYMFNRAEGAFAEYA